MHAPALLIGRALPRAAKVKTRIEILGYAFRRARLPGLGPRAYPCRVYRVSSVVGGVWRQGLVKPRHAPGRPTHVPGAEGRRMTTDTHSLNRPVCAAVALAHRDGNETTPDR